MNVKLASVILPVYNQADHIGRVLEEYMDSLQRLDIQYELLPVINGRRKDRSLEICREYEARFPVIRTICIDESGWGRAVRAGLAQAKGDLLCFANSARTTGKDLLLVLLYASVHTGTVIKVVRKIRENTRRRMGSLLYNLECRMLFDLANWDINGTPKAFTRDLAPLLELTRNDDLIDLEFNVICRTHEYQIVEIPTFSTTRHSGGSTTTLLSAYRMYAGAVRLWRELRKK